MGAVRFKIYDAGYQDSVAALRDALGEQDFDADSVQCRSGLVDLVVGVGRHCGGGHRLALVGQRFVDLVAENLAQVGDGSGADLGDPRHGEWIEGETGDHGGGFMAS